MSDRVDVMARALYEHWVDEDWSNEYCSWDALLDKETWRSRARAVDQALRSD